MTICDPNGQAGRSELCRFFFFCFGTQNVPRQFYLSKNIKKQQVLRFLFKKNYWNQNVCARCVSTNSSERNWQGGYSLCCTTGLFRPFSVLSHVCQDARVSQRTCPVNTVFIGNCCDFPVFFSFWLPSYTEGPTTFVAIGGKCPQ